MKNRRLTSSHGPLGLLLLSLAVAGCATSPTLDSSAAAEVTFDGLYPVKGGTADQAWARPDADISQYSKIRLQAVGVEYRPGGESGRTYTSRTSADHFEVTDEQRARFEAAINEAFREELARSEYFTLVDENGPDVLLIKGALLDVVSYVPPEPIGRGDVYLRRVGEATLVLEIRDSITQAILVRAVDRRAAERAGGELMRSDRVTNRAEARRLAKAWARMLRSRLDALAQPQE